MGAGSQGRPGGGGAKPGQHFQKTLSSRRRGPTEGLQKCRRSREGPGGGTGRDSKREDVKAADSGQCRKPGATVLAPLHR